MIRYAAVTDTGLVRKNNEDSLYIGCPFGGIEDTLFIVADGMGGHQGGEIASRFVVQKIPELLGKMKGRSDPFHFLEQVTEKTNAALYQLAQEKEELRGMGSTLVMAYFEEGIWHVINVGDSRAYYYIDGVLQQITKDHSLVEEMVEAGRLQRDDPLYRVNRNVITRAMGAEPYVEEDYFQIETAPGGRLLLCTDGLHGMVPDDLIAQVLEEEPDPDTAAVSLVQMARDAGGKDNITAIVADCTEEDFV
ncbi:MAG: Stp1/IreP family PP2C-type Ser/Thr phosphatase [Lachnospiraceae bacterium]|nr:Stp1/IreP family PP2C-type Ser/Thr phosphatase [Lachnospiraceae bacterium]